MKSSLQKNFAIAFYRYRMWLEEQKVADKSSLLQDINHFLAYLTFASADYNRALQSQKIFQKGLTAYKRFLRSSMNASESDVERRLCSIKNFCDFNVWSVASVASNLAIKSRPASLKANSTIETGKRKSEASHRAGQDAERKALREKALREKAPAI